MPTLSLPVNFVIPECNLWPEMKAGGPDVLSEDILAQRCVGAMNNWVVIPYIYFQRAGLSPTHSPTPQPGAINITSAHDFPLRERPPRAFIVSCRADAHIPRLANFVFEQNKGRCDVPNVAWTPHWPQPGLKARNPERGARFENLAYKGEVNNLWIGFRDDAFRAELKRIGVELRIDPRTPPGGMKLQMHDYSEADAVLAVRNLTEEDVKTKPASKLVNAWFAGTPALLGAEPAFQELRESELDYIEVDSPAAAIAALEKLKSQPELCEAMRQNGYRRAKDFTVEALTLRWVELLNGPVAEAYREWVSTPDPMKLLSFGVGAVREKLSKRQAQRSRTHGRRPFG
jgi:hypothetical protein